MQYAHIILSMWPVSIDGFGLLPQKVCVLKNNLICGEDDAVGEVWS